MKRMSFNAYLKVKDMIFPTIFVTKLEMQNLNRILFL